MVNCFSLISNLEFSNYYSRSKFFNSQNIIYFGLFVICQKKFKNIYVILWASFVWLTDHSGSNANCSSTNNFRALCFNNLNLAYYVQLSMTFTFGKSLSITIGHLSRLPFFSLCFIIFNNGQYVCISNLVSRFSIWSSPTFIG